MVLAFCNCPDSPVSVYQVSLNYLQYFYRYALDKSVTDKRMDGRRSVGQTDKAAFICSPFEENKKWYFTKCWFSRLRYLVSTPDLSQLFRPLSGWDYSIPNNFSLV